MNPRGRPVIRPVVCLRRTWVARLTDRKAGVLAKTGSRDRTQAVIAAYESGFVTPGRAMGTA
ncbi:hypothetical protein ACFV6Z_28660 [Streptomyces sp. NPDC059818]|uniref:hypothetical protein n=1 Tax=Streptomyces sp. NPDC059818 TaxID=3346962 RepID=UPI003649C3B4